MFANRLRSRMRNNRQIDVVAGVKNQTCKCAQLSPCKRLVALATKLRLDRPIFSASCAGYQIDTFIGAWKVQPSANVGRYVTQQPDMLQFGSIFWRSLKIKLGQPFERD